MQLWYKIFVKIVILFILVYLFFSKPAYAYLDPGYLSIIGTFLASSIAVIGVFFSSIKRKLKKIVDYLFYNKSHKN